MPQQPPSPVVRRSVVLRHGQSWLLFGAMLVCCGTAAAGDIDAFKEGPPALHVASIRHAAAVVTARAATVMVNSTSLGLQQLRERTTTEKLTAVGHLAQWLKDNHAEVNVEVHDGGIEAGMTLAATKAVRQGDVLLSFPTDLGFKRTSSVGVTDFMLDYILDVYDPVSPRALMWSTAPKPHELRHILNIPAQYLPLLQHPQLEHWIGHGLHEDMQLFYGLHQQTLSNAGITYADAIHAMGLIGTRIFNKPSGDGHLSTFYALPLLDMANHRNDCPHSNNFGPCQFDSSRECVYFTAGAAVAAGEEVCFFYGHLLPDKALLEYGYLPQHQELDEAQRACSTHHKQNTTVELFGIDRHDTDIDTEPLKKYYEKPTAFLPQNRSETITRVKELQHLLQQLQDGDDVAGAIQLHGPAEGDEDGWFLQQLLLWRQQRQHAVASEISRLRSLQLIPDPLTAFA